MLYGVKLIKSQLIGRHPEEHGIIGNRIAVSESGSRISLNLEESKDSAFPIWQNATPIWVNAENKGLKTAVIGWPGADVFN